MRESEQDEVGWESSPNEIKMFQEGPVWRDLETYLRTKREFILETLASDRELTMDQLRFYQGMMENLDDVLTLFDNIKQELEIKQQEENG